MLTLILKQSQVFFSYGTLHYFLLTDLSHDISTWGEVQICPAGVSLVWQWGIILLSQTADRACTCLISLSFICLFFLASLSPCCVAYVTGTHLLHQGGDPGL